MSDLRTKLVARLGAGWVDSMSSGASSLKRDLMSWSDDKLVAYVVWAQEFIEDPRATAMTEDAVFLWNVAAAAKILFAEEVGRRMSECAPETFSARRQR